MTSFLVVVLYPGQPSQLAAGSNSCFSLIAIFISCVQVSVAYNIVTAGLMISLIFMVLILGFRPLASEGLNTTQYGALLSNVLTLFVGIMLIVTKSLEDAAIRAGESFDPRERDIISSLLFIVNLLVMAIPGLKVLSDGNVVEAVIAKISNQFCNEEEKQKMADMKEKMAKVKDMRDKLLQVRDQLSDAQGALSEISGGLSIGHGGCGPTPKNPAAFEASAAPASLAGEISFMPDMRPRQGGAPGPMDHSSDKAWA